MYKAKFLENTEAVGANRIFKNAIIALQLKYLSNFWRSLEMPLITCKIEFKLKWEKYCFLSAAGVDNENDNFNNIIFTVKDSKLCAPVVTLSAGDNGKLSKLFRKGFERSVYWEEYKTKSKNKNTTNEYRNFLESNFFWSQ